MQNGEIQQISLFASSFYSDLSFRELILKKYWLIYIAERKGSVVSRRLLKVSYL